MGDYLVIPRGTIYHFEFENDTQAFDINSSSPVQTPKRYEIILAVTNTALIARGILEHLGARNSR